MSTEAEIWLPVPSLPGVTASSWGRIKLPDTEATMPHGGIRKYITKPIRGAWAKGTGGGRRIFHWRKTGKTYKVHRLVCEAFHGPPPFPEAVVMHLDENSDNNRPTNLAWGTQEQNLNFPGFLAYCRRRTGPNNPFLKGRAKKMRQFESGLLA